MKNWFKLLLFLLLSASVFPEARTGTEEHFLYFQKHFPRFDGSENEKLVFEYIEEKLAENGLTYTVSDFSGFADGHSFSKNIEVVIPGSSEDTLLLVVPVNHPADAGPEGPSGNLAAGLGYLLYKKERADLEGPPPVEIRVLFAGGEFAPDSDRRLGTELFLESYYPEENAAVLYLRLEEIPGTVVVKNGKDDYFSPYWIIDRVAESMELEEVPYTLELQYTQLFRLDISGKNSSIADYLKQELPAVEISSRNAGGAAETTPEERRLWLISFFQGLDRFLEMNEGRFPSGWDRHYIFIRLGESSFLVTEGVYIPLLLGVFTAILLFVLFFRRRMGKYRKVLFRKFWALIILFILIFLFLFLGTYVIKGMAALRGFRGIWQQRPLLFFFLKLSAALSLFFLVFRFVKRFPFPIIRSFYSASAIFLFFLLMAVVSVYNISLTYYFVWAFLWTVLFSIFHNRFAKLLCLAVAAFSLFFGLYEVFILDAREALEFILLSPIDGNLFFSLLLLPFILMIIRTAEAFHDAAVQELHVHGWVISALPVAAFVSLMAYGFLFPPFSAVNPRNIVLREEINYELRERKLTAKSEAPLYTVRVDGGGYGDMTAGTAESAVQYSENIPDLLDISYEKDEFLDRKYYTVTLAAEGKPARVAMELHSKAPLVIYDSNFPFRTSRDDNKGEIFIGVFPPTPLKIEVVLPKDSEVEAQFTVDYLQPPYSLAFSSENAVFRHRLRCISWLEL